MRDHEALSRLLDGDLPHDEAAALRTRIAEEPDLARAWDRMQVLGVELDALRDEVAFPPVRVSRPARRRPWGTVGATLALAAAVVLVVRSIEPDPVQLAATRTAEIQPVAAAVHEVRVAGDAALTYEASGAEDGVLTVRVRDGEATVRSGEDAVVLGPGDVRKLVLSGASGASTSDPELGRLRQRIRELEAEIGQVTFERDLLRGQVAAVSGEPQPWPEDLPPALTAEHAEETMRAALADLDEHEISEVDCSEYPCVATLLSPLDGAAATAAMKAINETVAERAGPDAFVYTITETSHPSVQPPRMITSVVLLRDNDIDRDLDTRLEFRTDPQRKQYLWSIPEPE